ncbi:MAG TPA: enoyl-CoA hydratase/isomerase family protein [Thermoplasmata archaeon]|nr:enoyl-CoA hydratase/isomerase family protein [Thermoplasmata archaeon]
MAVPPKDPVRVQLVRQGAVAVITLDSPPLNILTAELLHELSHQLTVASEDPKVRVIVLTSGIEKGFAAGASIQEMATMAPRDANRYGALGQALTLQIEACSLPVVAAVHGICVGGGSEIVEACDFILASEDAKFGQPEINLGVMPGWGGTQRLPPRIGPQRARAWVMLGRSMDARTAFDHGLVWKLVSRAELLPEAMRLATELASKPPLALAASKYALNAAIDRGANHGLALERRLWSQLFGTPGQREGMAAFLEKRSAIFSGREDWARDSRGFPWAPGSRRRVFSLTRRPRRPRRRNTKS